MRSLTLWGKVLKSRCMLQALLVWLCVHASLLMPNELPKIMVQRQLLTRLHLCNCHACVSGWWFLPWKVWLSRSDWWIIHKTADSRFAPLEAGLPTPPRLRHYYVNTLSQAGVNLLKCHFGATFCWPSECFFFCWHLSFPMLPTSCLFT